MLMVTSVKKLTSE